MFHNHRFEYSGQFKEGKRDGFGILYNEKGIPEYEGRFRNGTIHGRGKVFDGSGKKLQLHGVFQQGDFKSGQVYDNEGNLMYDGVLK